MKLLIFGSTGGTGRELIRQALSKRYDVTAFARNREKVDQQHEKLTVIEGDVLDFSSVEKAMQGHDAVLCSLGLPSVMDNSHLRAKGTKNIVQAMENKGIKGFVCQSSLGAGDSHEVLPFIYKYLLAPTLMRRLFADHTAQEKLIKQSQLDWVIVRPGVLTDGGYTGVYQHGFSAENKTVKTKISRADTADFMLQQLTDKTYLYQSPCLSY